MTEIVNIPAKRLLGIQEVGPSSFAGDDGAGAQFSERLWLRFIDLVIQAGLPLDVDMYGVSWPADDQTPPKSVHYFCGLESDGEAEGLTALDLDGGPYFQYAYSGPAKEIDKGFEAAYFEALPASGLRSREGQHLEIYGEEYDPADEIGRFRILIPVEAPNA